ncbi:uncharacterized protein [Centruroides vittatus]|uniref:uncharacterized protein n=1 Tax=Centruroides vittatus TaxID=120091 RepID=UPI00350F1948
MKQVVSTLSSVSTFLEKVARTRSAITDSILIRAYKQPGSNSQKLTRIISYTVVTMTVIIGVFVLAGMYIRSQRRECPCTIQENQVYNRQVASIEEEPLNAVASEVVPKKLSLPLKLQIDDSAGKMLNKNQKAHVNCIIEKRKASQIISQEPKTLMTPFGNITSDPGMVHLTGEKMIFSCFSGVKKNKPRRPIKNATFLGDKSRPRRETGKDCMCACEC